MLEATPFRQLLPWQVFEKGLLVAVLLDLALGGNGYLTQIGGFRLREIFYVLCMAWVALRLVLIDPVRLDATLAGITVFFIAVTALDALIGYIGGSQPAAILAELKPLSYFPMLLFFAVTIRKREDLSLVALILAACGFVVGLIYLMTLLAAAAGFIDYLKAYQFLEKSDEFIFRYSVDGQFIGFFYKGTFYTAVAAIFLLFDPFRKTKLLAAIAVVAMAMTLTRGVCGALLASILAGAALNQNWRRAPVLIGHAVLLAAILLIAIRSETAIRVASRAFQTEQPVNTPPPTPAPATTPEPAKTAPAEPPTLEAAPAGFPKLENVVPTPVAPAEKIKPDPPETWRPGDTRRMEDIGFVLQHTTLSTALVGHGLGAPIGSRNRIELTYVEIFYKQGLLGLAVWMLLFAYSFVLYLRIPAETKQFGLAFLLSSFFVAVATASNTFMTGSIGMAVVFIAATSLLVLSRERPHPMPAENWYGFRRRNASTVDHPAPSR